MTLIFVDPRSEKVLWEKNLHDKKKDQQTDSLTMPPALVNGKAFVGTTRREVFCMDAANGKEIRKFTTQYHPEPRLNRPKAQIAHFTLVMANAPPAGSVIKVTLTPEPVSDHAPPAM